MTTEPSPAAAGAVPGWTLGWRLRRALAHGDVSAEEIAGELGVVRTTASRWMNDHGAPPRTIYVRQWALRTGVSYDWLASGDDGAGGQQERRPQPVMPTGSVAAQPDIDTAADHDAELGEAAPAAAEHRAEPDTKSADVLTARRRGPNAEKRS